MSDPVPADVAKRLAAWYKLWNYQARLHYCLGGLSVTAAAISAAVGGQIGQYLAALAAVLTALIGFIQPERKYLKFVRAWRVLDSATVRFKEGLLDKKALLDALDRGETLITEFEDYKGK